MNEEWSTETAEIAARRALNEVEHCIEQHKSFVFEAGAGAGKTFSLVRCLRQIVETNGTKLIRNHQRIACITFTNVAREEIQSRTDGHPAILSETIHSFCWALLRDLQKDMQRVLPEVGKWSERLSGQEDLNRKIITYDYGYPRVDSNHIALGHSDVINLVVRLMKEPKFRKLFSAKYPILLVDEYQDTNKHFVESLINHFISTEEGPLIGFFGDHWQVIYGSESCGEIIHQNLVKIDKNANFRSTQIIVEALNRIRPELPQVPADITSDGQIRVFHTNGWTGPRRDDRNFKGDLPETEAHVYLQHVMSRLNQEGWDTTVSTKILMLTHNILATEQGYSSLPKIFDRAEDYAKKENNYIKFLTEVVEPVCQAYKCKQYGEMFSILGRVPKFSVHEDKLHWINTLKQIMEIRNNGTIGQMLDYLNKVHPRWLSERIAKDERKYERLQQGLTQESDEVDKRFVERMDQLRQVPYAEVIELTKFINEQTPFATNHGVKGEEFENVLVVCGRGWTHYNFGQMLEWFAADYPETKEATLIRNRNLFYVACSRPKKRLALLFTQELTVPALRTLSYWFGADSIEALPDFRSSL